MTVKKAVNEGKMTKQEAIDKYDSKENLVNSCTQCNRGEGGKHSKTPSSTDGPGKFKIDKDKASPHVVKKLEELEKE